jgi:hypothetical protein
VSLLPAEQRGRWAAAASEVYADPRLRWSAVAAGVVLWLALAWGDPHFLALLAGPAAVARLARRYPHEPREPDELY